MLIKSLRMKNFRQFKDTTEINFSCDVENKKNVTVILGDNTFGKTTLLQAFNWCLYGTVNFPNNDKNLLNYEIAMQMKPGRQEKVKVEITLLHDNSEYTITRTQEYFVSGEKLNSNISKVSMSRKQSDGQTKPVIHTKETINNILPEGLSTYFFFDTERISTVSDRRDIGKAIKDFLGLSAIGNAVRHLGDRSKKTTVIGKLYGSMDLSGDSRAQEALEKIQNSQEEIEKILERLEDCKDQIAHYEKRKEEVEKFLRANQSTAELQKKSDSLEKQIATEKRLRAQSIENYFSEFNSCAVSFFMHPLLSVADDFLKEVKVDDKGVSDITKNSIMELIKRGRCICGREICEGNEAFEHLMAEIKFVPPESIGNTVRHYRERLKNFSQSFEQNYNRLKKIHDDLEISKNRINEWEYDLDDYRKKIAGKENMSQREDELVAIRSRLYELRNKKDNLNINYGVQENIIKTNKKIYDSCTASSEKNREIKKFLEYAEEIKDWFEKSFVAKEREIREKLELEVNKIFDEMYSGTRSVEIDNQYRVRLMTTVGANEIVSGESEGANRVKNFAFIAGIVELARQQILKNIEKNIGISSEPYPLVMDAPFSNADEKHTAGISKVLPEIAEQIIMFVMQKDWNYAEPVMKDRVGKKYLLKKNSETFTKIEEE